MKIASNLTITVYVLLFLNLNLFAQIDINDTIYIKQEKKIILKEYIDSFDNIQLDLFFTLNSKDDIKATTYSFKIDNLSHSKDIEIKELKFKEIRDTIPKIKFEGNKYFTLKDLAMISACDLYFLLGDTKNIYLIREEGDIYYKYKLNYLSTQRGWEPMNTN